MSARRGRGWVSARGRGRGWVGNIMVEESWGGVKREVPSTSVLSLLLEEDGDSSESPGFRFPKTADDDGEVREV